MAFQPKHINRELSPYTGWTRETWIEAAKYLLEGVFSAIENFSSPVVVKRTETKITYPHSGAPEKIYLAECSAERFEGLTRTLFIAAPIIAIEPDLEMNGIPLRKYYKEHILRSVTRGNEEYVGTYEDLQELTNHADPKRCFQQTVETCALVIGLWASKKEIWEDYSQEERDRIAAFLKSYANAHTVPQNWRLFNMLDLAFLWREGYEIDEEIMMDHAQSILHYYAGDGWYRDGHAFDYYSCWAFQFYAPLWNEWYGYERMNKIAEEFEKNSNELMKTYPQFFDEEGRTNLWGRSCIYRFASVSAFDGNLFCRNSTVNCGLARRIASGSIRQFLCREDFLAEGVPTLGFYGQFSPLVQGYSCAESVYWMGKAFLFLHLPENHPFWTQREENGVWERLSEKEVYSTTLNAPALAFTNHKANGATILRSGKVVKSRNDRHAMWNYGKLAYSTQYPWESSLTDSYEAMQYVLEEDGSFSHANVILWHGEKNGVLYRRQFFDYDFTRESFWMQALDLADFAMPNGIFRADRLRLFRRPVSLTLGSFGFPDNKTECKFFKEGNAKAVVLKGYDSLGNEKQLAFTVWGEWELSLIKSEGTNPDSKHSLIPVAKTLRKKEYGYEPYLLLSLTQTKEDHSDFTKEELFPLLQVLSEDERGFSAYGKTKLVFSDKTVVLDFDEIEGELSL